jgi:hypothetical protein
MTVQFRTGSKGCKRDVVIEITVRVTQLIQPHISGVMNIGRQFSNWDY